MAKRKSTNLENISPEPFLKVKTNETKYEERINMEVLPYQDNKCWLQLLPTEVLEYIYSFLSPKTLLAIASLNCGRISDLTGKTRVADFSSCNAINPDEMKQFLSARQVKRIRKINLNNMFLVTPFDLVRNIVRCKNLTSLTVLECGVTYQHMRFILSQCNQISELCWNVVSPYKEENTSLKFNELKIKKLYLHLDCPKASEFAFHLLKACPETVEAYFNYAIVFYPPIFPLISYETNTAYKLHSNCSVNIIFDDYYEIKTSLSECIEATKWCSCSDPAGPLCLQMTSPYLQIVTRNEDFSTLELIPDKSVQKLVLYCSSKMFLDENIVELQRVIGNNLTFLHVKDMKVSNKAREGCKKEASLLMCDILPKLILGCSNIQDLTLYPLHFNGAFQFQTLNCLKGLKSFRVSSCVFLSTEEGGLGLKKGQEKDSRLFLQEKTFEEFVKNSKEVQHFAMSGCKQCSNGPKDREISSISKWTKLKTLNLIKIQTLQFCHFLRNIAEECPNFKSAQVIDIGSSSLNCHFIPNVMHLLHQSSNLMQLITNLDSLYVKSPRFWNAVSSATNLQSLCLTLTSNVTHTNKLIADALEKLPYLNLFHFNSNNIDDDLIDRVRKIMKRHGVKNPKIDMVVLSLSGPDAHTCLWPPHLYID